MEPQRTPDAAQRGPNPGLIAAGVIGGAAFVGVLLFFVLFAPSIGRSTVNPLGAREATQARDIAAAIVAYKYQSGHPLPLDGWKQTLIQGGFIEPDRFEPWDPEFPVPAFFYVPSEILNRADGEPHKAHVFVHPNAFEEIGILVLDDGAIEILEKAVMTELLSRMRNPDGTPFAPHAQP